MTTKRPGAITLIAVYLTATAAFLLILGTNLRAIDERTRIAQATVSDQAFYAAQSCLDEALFQLRSNASYSGVSTLGVGSASCSASVQDDGSGHNGTVTSVGRAGSSIRSIASSYHDAGPAITRTTSTIMHVLDRSGSMQNGSCSVATATTQTACQTAGGVWSIKIDQAKAAAEAFDSSFMSSAYDHIGLVSFNDHPRLDQVPTSSLTTINTAIGRLSASGTTDIGDAITMAAGQLPSSLNGTRAMIVLTDGIPNSSCGADCTVAAAQTAKNNGIMVFVIGLGSDVNDVLLRGLASQDRNGQPLYYFAPDATQLQSIYLAIAQQITSYNIGQGSWNEQ